MIPTTPPAAAGAAPGASGGAGPLSGKTILMSGGSRGIGLAIALRAARDGANIAMLAKTDTPHPKLEGTVHTAAEAIREAGGRALPIVGDVRDEASITEAVLRTVGEFGGIDIVVNNASVIDLSGSLELATKKYDLMQDVNVRGTFLLSRAALPQLKDAENPHILSLSPPLNVTPKWLGAHTGYSLAKFGMTMATLGLASEFASDGIAANTLWPRTTIATAAVQNVIGGDRLMARLAHARDLRGCGLRGADVALARAHGPDAHRRRRAGSRGCDGLLRLRRGARHPGRRDVPGHLPGLTREPRGRDARLAPAPGCLSRGAGAGCAGLWPAVTPLVPR